MAGNTLFAAKVAAGRTAHAAKHLRAGELYASVVVRGNRVRLTRRGEALADVPLDHLIVSRPSARQVLFTGGFIFGRVPCLGRLLTLKAERNADDVALRRRDHAPSPVLRDDRHPLAGEINGSVGARGRRAAACAWCLRRDVDCQQRRDENQRDERRKDTSHRRVYAEHHFLRLSPLKTASTNMSVVHGPLSDPYRTR